MLDKLMLLLNQIDDSREELIQTLIGLCKDEATAYCNLEEYDKALDYIVIQMVIERFNRIGSEGATSQTSSGMKTDYNDFYSDKVVRMLQKHRKVKTI